MPRQRKRHVEDGTSSSTKRRRLNKSTDPSIQQSLSTSVVPVNQPVNLTFANKPEVDDIMEENVSYTNGRFVREAKRRVTYKIVGKNIVHTIVKEEKVISMTTSVDSREHTLIPICARAEHLDDDEDASRDVDIDLDSHSKTYTSTQSSNSSDAGLASKDNRIYGSSHYDEAYDAEVSGDEDGDSGAKSNGAVNEDYNNAYTERDINVDVGEENEVLPPWHGQCVVDPADPAGRCCDHKTFIGCCLYRWWPSKETNERCWPEDCPKEIYELREAWENKTLGKCQNIVREVDIGPGRSPYVYLYTDEMIKMSRAHAQCFEQLRVERTWNLGTCYVTMLGFRNHNVFQDRYDKDLSPLMIGPILLHFDQEYSTYKKFFRHVRNAIGFSDRETTFLGPDMKKPKKDRVIHQAMKEVFGENVALADSTLVHMYIRKVLRSEISCCSRLLEVIEEINKHAGYELTNLKCSLYHTGYNWRLTPRASEILKDYLDYDAKRCLEGLEILLGL